MKETLSLLLDGKHLTVEQAAEAVERVMSGQAPQEQVAAMLAMLEMRGPTIDELTGAAQVMRSKATPVTVPDGLTPIDIVGTGGDHAGTFNISTAAAIVAAAAAKPHDVVVAKHGSRSVTSKSGASEVLTALGVQLVVKLETQTRCLEQIGLCFCFAPAHHPAMKHVAPVRAVLQIRTIFNLLGPLTNPAGAARQVLGVHSAKLTEPMAQVLKNLGSEHVMVVHGMAGDGIGLDELITFGPNQVSHLHDQDVRTYLLSPDDMRLHAGKLDDLKVEGPQQSADVVRSVLSGQKGHARDVVCLNAAAGLVVGDVVLDMHEGLAMAGEAIDSGAAAETLEGLVKITQSDPTPQP